VRPAVSGRATLRLGVVASAGGSVLDAMMPAIEGRVEVMVVTDRPCGAAAVAARHGLRHLRVEDTDRRGFSATVAGHTKGCDAILLLFSRLVSAELYMRLPTYNIHPSLLPAFPGIGAVVAAQRARTRFLGATLHLVDESVDGGPILAQAALPIRADEGLDVLGNLSFLQKTYLALLLTDSCLDGRLQSGPTPRITDIEPRTVAWSPHLAEGDSLEHMRRLVARYQPWVPL
jgi:phosphoribosylglycinamide formyltransferase-1